MENASEVAADPTAPGSLLGRVSLIPGEKPASYEELLGRFTQALKPADILEEMWVRDVVDLTWEVLRLRRLKANLLSGCACEGMHQVLISLGAGREFTASRGWAARDPEATEHAEGALQAAGLSMDTVMARTLSERIIDIERIERMTTAAEHRRNAALQQIRRHRVPFGEKLRRAVSEAEHTELRLIAPERAPAAAPA
jgi:hypothetical protein